MITNYKDLPVGKYLQVIDIMGKEGMDDTDRHIAILSVLTGKTEEELLTMPLSEFEGYNVRSGFLNEDTPEAQGNVKAKYRIGKYVLKPIKAVNDMSTAQYIDFQTFAKGRMLLPEILSVLLVPKGKAYNDGYDIIAVQNAIRDNMGILDANEVLAFFLRNFVRSIRASLTYSEWIVKRMPDGSKKAEIMRKIAEVRTLLQDGGDGFQMLMQSPKPADAVGMRCGR